MVFRSNTGFAASTDLSTLGGATGAVLHGTAMIGRDYSGVSVSGAGDVNGDGIDDLIIGARGAGSNSAYSYGLGGSYVVYGSNSGLAGSLDLSTLDGTNGVFLNGVGFFDFTGISVGAAGDVNGDGIDDLIIGARDGSPNGIDRAGTSYVVFGQRAVTIPEPGSALVVLGGLVAWLTRRRRR